MKPFWASNSGTPQANPKTGPHCFRRCPAFRSVESGCVCVQNEIQRGLGCDAEAVIIFRALIHKAGILNYVGVNTLIEPSIRVFSRYSLCGSLGLAFAGCGICGCKERGKNMTAPSYRFIISNSLWFTPFPDSRQ